MKQVNNYSVAAVEESTKRKGKQEMGQGFPFEAVIVRLWHVWGLVMAPMRGLAGGLGTDFLKWFGHMLTSLKRFHLFCVRGLQTVFDHRFGSQGLPLGYLQR